MLKWREFLNADSEMRTHIHFSSWSNTGVKYLRLTSANIYIYMIVHNLVDKVKLDLIMQEQSILAVNSD